MLSHVSLISTRSLFGFCFCFFFPESGSGDSDSVKIARGVNDAPRENASHRTTFMSPSTTAYRYSKWEWKEPVAFAVHKSSSDPTCCAQSC